MRETPEIKTLNEFINFLQALDPSFEIYFYKKRYSAPIRIDPVLWLTENNTIKIMDWDLGFFEYDIKNNVKEFISRFSIKQNIKIKYIGE